MILVIVVLLFLSFLQATLVPINLVLIVLICRSFVVEEKENLYLAFGFGLLMSLLIGFPLGILSLIYLLMIYLVYFIKSTPLAAYWVIILPLTLIISALDQFLENPGLGLGLHLGYLLRVGAFALPLYLVIRFWEERFIPRSDIKLKVGN